MFPPADPARGSMCVPDTLARALHSGNTCMNECPSVPHVSEQEEEEKTRGRGRTNEGGIGRLVLFQRQRGRGGPLLGPYVPTCGPFPRAVRFDVVFFKAVFTELGPLSRLFSCPKMAETIQHGRARLFLRSLPFSLSHVFPPFFPSAKGRSAALRIQWRFSISEESFVAAHSRAFILLEHPSACARGNAYHVRSLGSNSKRMRLCNPRSAIFPCSLKQTPCVSMLRIDRLD